MTEAESIPAVCRYERKFVAEGMTRREVEHLLRESPKLLREVHHERDVNNIYFDSLDLKHLRDTVEGAFERVKLRIRWYGACFGPVERPALEIKQKSGSLVRKQSLPLPSFTLKRGIDLKTLCLEMASSPLPVPVRQRFMSHRPVLLNRYARKYFLSSDGRYRVTVDDSLASCPLGPRRNFFLQRTIDREHVIVEIKYDPGDEEGAERITQALPFRLTRWSKYASGFSRDDD
jgi:hypothetical protein